MPRGGPGRGGKRSHKGRNRHFTSVEELKEQSKKAEKEKEWRRQQGIPSDDSDEEEGGEGAVAKKVNDSESDSSSENDIEEKNKGVGHLIQIQNPNRGDANRLRKVTDMQPTEAPQLSRKEREEIQKQQAAAHYRKLHNEGKTDEARADLARLQIIRKQREEAAKKKADEQSKKDATTQAAEKKLLDRKSGKK